MRSKDDILLAMILAAMVAASLVVLVEAGDPSRPMWGRQFQSMLGGLGMGCQVDLARCGWQFDPRIMGEEDAAFASLAGLSEISPWHALALFPMRPQEGWLGQSLSDAPVAQKRGPRSGSAPATEASQTIGE